MNNRQYVFLKQNSDLYNNDIRSMILAFYSGVKIIEDITKAKDGEVLFTFEAKFLADRSDVSITGFAAILSESVSNTHNLTEYISGDYRDKQAMRNPFKLACYHVLSMLTGRTLPWGCLTGMRPTKIALKLYEDGYGDEDIVEYYKKIHETTEAKANISLRVAKYESELIDGINFENSYCLYVGIPFCPTRCVYCSFTAYPIKFYKDRVENYIESLGEELRFISEKYKDKELIAIYIGGGTPTSISSKQLDKLLSAIEKYFDLKNIREYTVEAGRPDSLLAEQTDGVSDKLRVLKAHGVDRISINPQSMNDNTLDIIGRGHSTADIVKAYRQARQCGFDNINMDIIAGLPGEDISYMDRTLNGLEELKPDSITVHSLAIKRAAGLRERLSCDGQTMFISDEIHADKTTIGIGKQVDEMIDMVDERVTGMGLIPYYLYRQKNISGNLENIGYALPGKASLYNVLIMEEKLDIIAAGAGASSKLIIRDEGGIKLRVDRIEDVKNVDVYIDRIDEMIRRKDL